MTASGKRFSNVALLGEGGMARVYLVVSEGLGGANKLVVLKLLRPSLANDASHRAMFLDEARLAVKLEHPNIVQTFEAGERTGLYYLLMEFLDGQPLNRVRQASAQARMPLPLHLLVLLRALRGLSYAHELSDLDGKPLKIVHRDMSPQNVFVTYDGRVKVVDFGIAKAAISRERTETGIFKGKTAYASPEQVLLGQDLDQRSDVFSVGVMLYEALTGRRFWGERPDVAILMELANGKVPVLPPDPSLPKQLVAICERALKWERTERFATSAAMADELEAYLKGLEQPPTQEDLARWIEPHFAVERSKLRKKIETRQASAGDEDFLASLIAHDEDLQPTAPPPRASSTALTHTASASQPRSSRYFTPAVALVAVAAAAAAALVVGGRPAVPDERAAASSASAFKVAVSAAEPATLTLDVRCDPADAGLEVDGVPWRGDRRFPRDRARHVLRLSREGFEPRSEEVVFDRDLSLSVALRPLPDAMTKPAASALRLPTSAVKAPRASGSAKNMADKPLLDEESPYSR